MAEEEKSKEKQTPKVMEGIVLIVFRLIDAGLAPWVAVALFLLGAAWLCMRNMDSKDTLTLISGFGTLHGLMWLGWIAAFIMIPICKAALNNEKKKRNAKLERLEKEHNQALELLKKYKLDELKLEN